MAKQKNAAGLPNRTVVIGVRLEPKLRYLAEIAARKHRRSLNSFIEWAIEDSLNRVYLHESVAFNGQHNRTVADEAANLWDVDDPDRFAKLAVRYPDMLTHEEQVLWKLIRENGYLWRGKFHNDTGEWTWKIEENSLVFERLRERWDTFTAVAKGEADKGTLPTWPRKKPEEEEFDDDDIPF
ncbi:MAG: hypothetical protein ACREX4_24160 [Gammaproteobacteria bacterium]